LSAKRNPAALTLFALAGLTALAQIQSPTQPPDTNPPPSSLSVPVNRSVIFLDPAHGGIDGGSRIGDGTLEKDVTLAFAFKLRSLLSARGFTVLMTRDADAPAEPNTAGSPLTLDDRAGIANHAHPVACLVVHATGTGNGVHLYTSELDPTAGVPPVVPWLSAQAPWVAQSRNLKRQIASALSRSGVALVNSSASVRPVDSMSCPALVLELAPQSDDPDSITYADYQQHAAEAVAAALVFWPTQLQPPTRLLSASPATAAGVQP
jgi:N-acetylmuramoyl-L-alanine amidase